MLNSDFNLSQREYVLFSIASEIIEHDGFFPRYTDEWYDMVALHYQLKLAYRGFKNEEIDIDAESELLDWFLEKLYDLTRTDEDTDIAKLVLSIINLILDDKGSATYEDLNEFRMIGN